MTENPQDFEQLRSLLALKRYEQPPPGYFHSFSRDVIVRIRTGDLGEADSKWWAFDGSWLNWLWESCERRPVLAGGVGVAFCGFIAAATMISMNDATDGAIAQTVPANNQYVSVQNGLGASGAADPVIMDVSYTDFPGLVRSSSENRSQPSLFSGIWQQSAAEPAGITLIGTHY